MTEFTSKAQFLVDEQGHPKSVLLSLSAYRRLLKRLEDLEDALELDHARRNATGFTDYSAVRAQLQKAGRL